MKLRYTILYVASVADTLAFAANSFAKGLTGVPFEPATLDRPAPPVEIGFVTDTVEADFDRAVSAGSVIVKRPERKPWGQLVGYVRDLNGFLVEICSPVPG